jgi:DNA transformation protein
MPSPNDFITYLLDLLHPLGPVRAKRMFGGFGIYLNDWMFGIVVDEVFYLKADDRNRKDFEAQNLPPFTYQKKGKEITMSFYPAPADAMEDGELLCQWAKGSLEAAKRSRRARNEGSRA